MNTALSDLSKPTKILSSPSWLAKLQLTFGNDGRRTVLRRVSHQGPLSVQRAFYPESSGCCHLYILHPPGGLVAGDRLELQVKLEDKGHALLTTPAASKIYRSNAQQTPQQQINQLQLADHCTLEWLPQETIVFDQACAQLTTEIDLQDSSKLIGWDFICLGRRAAKEKFVSGYVKQNIKITQKGLPLYLEKLHIDGDSTVLSEAWGLQSASVTGTFYCTIKLNSEKLTQLREACAKLLTDKSNTAIPLLGITQVGDLLIGRYLGHSAEQGRLLFTCLWQQLRPLLLGLPVTEPRIWRT